MFGLWTAVNWNKEEEERLNQHIKSANWKNKTAVGKHTMNPIRHEMNLSELCLECKQLNRMGSWNIMRQFISRRTDTLLNIDSGNMKYPLLNLFAL